MPTFSVATKKKGRKNKRRTDGRKRGRKERNIQRRKEKKGEEKRKKKFYINLFFRAHMCLFTFLSLFNIRSGIITPINQL